MKSIQQLIQLVPVLKNWLLTSSKGLHSTAIVYSDVNVQRLFIYVVDECVYGICAMLLFCGVTVIYLCTGWMYVQYLCYAAVL
jgi:hypothetical protein